jgi:hypothetical protein
MRIIAALSLLLLTATASGHHSRSHFSDEISIVEGTLVAVHWVNPHVGFTVDITNEAGEAERWRVEGVTNLGGMRRDGVAAERFTIGSHVRFAGNRSMRRPRDFLATNVLLEDGVEVVLDGAAGPFWEGEFIGRPDPSLVDTMPVDAAAENRGIFRVWSMAPNGVGQRAAFPFTDAAIAARADWDPLDNFAENCEPEGMPRIMRNPHPFEFVDDGSEIRIVSELYDLIRTVHMGEDAPPADAPASPLGYSVGRWDGDSTLVVTTTHVNWPYFDNIGTPQSEDARMHETFTVSGDQTRLDYRLTVTDPGTFTEPAVYERYWLALGAEIELYDCQVF